VPSPVADTNHRLKVLHVIPSVSPMRGGPSVLVRTIARSLARAGLEVHIAATDDNGQDRLDVPHGTPVLEEGPTYWYFPRQTRFYTFSWPLSWWLSRHVRDYDLVHIHGLFSFATLPAALWASRSGVPYIVRPLGTLNRWGMRNRHPLLKKLSFRLIESRILAGAAVVHYTSQQEQLEAAELGIVQKSVVIPNPVDETVGHSMHVPGRFRALYPQLADRTVILFLSRLDAKKGLDLLLPAFGRVREQHPEVALVIAGNGDPGFVAALQQDATRLGIASDIIWTGFLAGEKKAALLTDANVFTLPSYSENFGMAVAEAIATGLPVVVSDQVGIHREILNAQAGLVVPCTVEELARALIQLVANSPLRSQMGENGTCLSRSLYSLDAVTGKLMNLYAELTNPLLKLARA
jgi:glycosyltransferase involved in cell wall biosynthesis